MFLAEDLTLDLVTLYNGNWLSRLNNSELVVFIKSLLYIIDLDLHLLATEGNLWCEQNLDLLASNNSLELLKQRNTQQVEKWVSCSW